MLFESLADHIKQDEYEGATKRFIRWAAVAVIAFALFGGLYFAVRLME